MSIQALKDVLALPMSLHMAIEKAGADGKIDLSDVGLLVEPAMKIGPFANGLKNVPKALKELSDADRADVMSWAKTSYNLADDDLEEKIEKALSVALHLGQFVGMLLPDEPTKPA